MDFSAHRPQRRRRDGFPGAVARAAVLHRDVDQLPQRGRQLNNIFDQYPDPSPTGPRPEGGSFSVFNEIFPYSGFSPFGFNGRFLYARATVNW